MTESRHVATDAAIVEAYDAIWQASQETERRYHDAKMAAADSGASFADYQRDAANYHRASEALEAVIMRALCDVAAAVRAEG